MRGGGRKPGGIGGDAFEAYQIIKLADDLRLM
jgi:hypothetical protein